MDSAQINEAALTASGNKRWKRIMLLIIAITVHNIPGRFYMQSKCSKVKNNCKNHLKKKIIVMQIKLQNCIRVLI
jgi:hypothetical protein